MRMSSLAVTWQGKSLLHGLRIIQVPVNHDIDVTFANVLRAILRHDPDTILVGEIRDYETAEIAIQSALIGGGRTPRRRR